MARTFLEILTKGDKKAADAFLKLQRENEKLRQGLKKTGRDGKQSFNGVATEMKSVVGNLIGPMGLAGAITAVVNELRIAYQEMRARAKETAEMSMSIGQARNIALKNLPGNYEGGHEQFMQDMHKVSKESNVDLKTVLLRSSAPLSTKGEKSRESFLSAMKLAAEQHALTGGDTDMGPLASSLMSMSMITGHNDAKVNFGWLKKAQDNSNITSEEGMIKQIPGIVGAKAMGDTAEQAMERRATLSTLLVDSTGDSTAEAARAYETSLMEKKIIPTMVKKMVGGRLKETISWNQTDGANTAEREQQFLDVYKNATPEIQKEMMRKFGRQAGAKSYLRALTDGDKAILSIRDDDQAKIAMPQVGDAAMADEIVAQQKSGVFGSFADKKGRQQAALERAKISNQRIKQAKAQNDIDFYDSFMYEQGKSRPSRWMDWADQQVTEVFSDQPAGDRLLERSHQMLADIESAKAEGHTRPTVEMISAYGEDATILFDNTQALRDLITALRENGVNPNRQEVD